MGRNEEQRSGRKFGALAHIKEMRESMTGDQEEEVLPYPSPRRGRPRGKRSNPDFESTTLLLRRKTKKKAMRLLEDRRLRMDLSDLAEKLLGEWIEKFKSHTSENTE